ncbi:PR domain zinc finger protein 2 [Chanos chanos]|uniref:PR domain zinc finger protein 2 n=1 Tax=Chanos chanos TaxID=29144 RepID=A0A6J2WCK3_CHACN|nr:PR domain zinc finger protein 2-like [Chanos chanos]
MVTLEQANPNTVCQVVETECSTKLKEDFGSDAHPLDPDAELDPDYDPDIDPQGLCSFPCQHCQRRFNTKQGLERHTHIHASAVCQTQAFKCKHCGKAFSTQFGRRRHERTHDNLKKRSASLTLTGTTCISSQSFPGESENPNVSNAEMQGGRHVLENSDPTKQFVSTDNECVADLDENVEPKDSHVCRYCKKSFGTHTNLRRHQRRIHEHHLLSKGVYKKGLVLHDAQSQKQQPVSTSPESSTVSPKPVCPEEEGDQEEEYMVDISSNISENLSFYIDGKIVSTSAVSNCEVIEVNSGSAAVIGLDAVIISPAQITQALKIETSTCTVAEIPGQPCVKRRTSTPPLLPQIKTELESESILATTSPSSSSSSSSSSPTSSSLSSSPTASVGTLQPQPTESVAFHKEKTVYLSPKLKQLLQNQDGNKPVFALITDGQKLGPPLSLTVLPAGSGRFKRRTTSPPSSPQQTPVLKGEKLTPNAGLSCSPKEPKTESHYNPSVIGSSSKEETNTMNLSQMDPTSTRAVLPLDWSDSRTGGSSCNQQPLDLSNPVGKRDMVEDSEEAVLDLSMHRKNTVESDSSGNVPSQMVVKRSKPSSSMLQKVLMNEYASVDITGVDTSCALGSLSTPVVTDLAVVAVSDPPPVNPEKLVFELALPSTSLNPPPPSLTPVAMHPVSPFASSLGSPTPPPPVLPSASSPVTTPTQEFQPVCSTAQSSLPVLTSRISSSTAEVCTEQILQPVDCGLNVTLPDWVNSATGGLAQAIIPANSSLELQNSDTSTCEIAQSTLAVGSVMVSEAQLFPPALTVNESNISTVSFTPNTVVIEYTVSLESSENVVSTLQANAIESLSGKISLNHTEMQELQPSFQSQSHDPAIIVTSAPKVTPPSSSIVLSSENPTDGESPSQSVASEIKEEMESKEEPAETSVNYADVNTKNLNASPSEKTAIEESSLLDPHCKRFMCNVCDKPFQSMKGLSHHISDHAEEWPYKCEFCVQLFGSDTDLLDHRSNYHGIGKIYVCSACSKEFAFLCNLEQHQKDLHPGQMCSHTEVENGKLRPENHNNPAKTDPSNPSDSSKTEASQPVHKSAAKEDDDDGDFDHSTEELYTTIKIMASEGIKPKGPNVRLGINQHYPSFKPPPFPYHNRTPVGSVASATNFTTHNIPQTFSTAIRCTKCGKSFDNMPELHKHILACANASDKKRYTPKKNPIPLRQFAKAQNGVLSPARAVNGRQNVSQKLGQLKKFNIQEPAGKLKVNALSKKKSQLVTKAISHRSKSSTTGKKTSVQEEQDVYVCPHCSREFIYHASLKKHMVVSCPRKPVPKNTKKRKGSTPLAQENNGNLRRRLADRVTKPQGSNHGQKPLGKTRTSESGPADNAKFPLKSQINKGKITPDMRLKRPAILSTSAAHPNKKSKPILKGNIEQAAKLNVLSPVAQSNSAVRHGMGVLGGFKEDAEVKPQVQPPSKKEERFSVRVRERVGGPVTRSLQQVTVMNAVVKQEDGSNQRISEPLVDTDHKKL